MATGQRRPASVIHHGDQGSQYTSVAFGLRCKEAGVRPSTGSVGDAYDNAPLGRSSSAASPAGQCMRESFFATLECESPDRRKFRAKAEARMTRFEFIEGRYNPSRVHSAPGYKSPVTFDRNARKRPRSATGQLSTKPGQLRS